MVLFTRLTSSPALNRALYTSTNPDLCEQVKTSSTKLFEGRIPSDLFQRLLAEGLIVKQRTQMEGVVDDAYLILPQAMQILQQYFK